jgi:hypothetical protein
MGCKICQGQPPAPPLIPMEKRRWFYLLGAGAGLLALAATMPVACLAVIETVPLFGGGNEAAAITSAVIAAIGFLGFGMWTTCYAIFRLIEG